MKSRHFRFGGNGKRLQKLAICACRRHTEIRSNDTSSFIVRSEKENQPNYIFLYKNGMIHKFSTTLYQLKGFARNKAESE